MLMLKLKRALHQLLYVRLGVSVPEKVDLVCSKKFTFQRRLRPCVEIFIVMISVSKELTLRRYFDTSTSVRYGLRRL